MLKVILGITILKNQYYFLFYIENSSKIWEKFTWLDAKIYPASKSFYVPKLFFLF